MSKVQSFSSAASCPLAGHTALYTMLSQKNHGLNQGKCRFVCIIRQTHLKLSMGKLLKNVFQSNSLRPIMLLGLAIFLHTYLSAQTLNEVLGRPADSSVTMSVMFDVQTEVYWEYGTISGNYPVTTTTFVADAATPLEVDFSNLLPDTRYYYRTRYRINGTWNAFTAGPERTFHTQRAVGSTFTFTIEADEHLYDKKGVKNMYKVCLANQAADHPDFMMTLGDIFGDDHHPYTITSAQLDSLHKDYRPFLGTICHSVPFLICLGNHEGEFNYYLNQTPPNNMAVYATLWRKFYYPNPIPNHFYSGNPDIEPYGMDHPENYYSFTWGNALFVVLDVYRYQCDTSAKPENWAWTLGFPQYTWLKNTLESSQAQYKFVFAHHVRGQGRGALTNARYFEWGGYEMNGNYTFATKRPGWSKPIHQLFVDNGVNVFFQGHDHLFAHEVLDNITYQEVPMAADSTYEIGMLANAGAYTSDTIPGTGHLRVIVSPSCVKVDFVRAYLPADTVSGEHHNGEVGFSYTIGSCNTGVAEKPRIDLNRLTCMPNPFQDQVAVGFDLNKPSMVRLEITDMTGKSVYVTNKWCENAGRNSLIWDGNNLAGMKAPNGAYLCRLITNENTNTARIVKLK